MALQLEVTLKSGVVADYWRVDEVKWARLYTEPFTYRVEVLLGLYVNSTVAADKEPVVNKKVVVDVLSGDLNGTDLIPHIYSLVKTWSGEEWDITRGGRKLLVDFTAAEDC